MHTTKKALLESITAIILVSLIISGLSVAILYQTSADQLRADLTTAVKYQAELIETTIGELGPDGLQEQHLDRLRHLSKAFNIKQQAHSTRAIKFMIGYRRGQSLDFLVDAPGYKRPASLAIDPASPYPLIRALLGESGFYQGPDFRKKEIFAAYEAMPTLGIGLLAKIDKTRVMAPLVGTGALILLSTFSLLALSSWLIFRIANRLQRRLENSLALNQAVLNTAADGILTINSEGVIQTFNPHAETIFGYRADEVVGKNVSLLMPAPYQAEHDSYLKHHMETGEEKIIGIGREVEGMRKDGSTFPLELAVTRMIIDGKPYFTGVTRDIGVQKAAQERIRENETRLSFLFAKSPVVIYECEIAGDFACTFISENIDELFGYQAQQFLQDPKFWAHNIHPDDAPRVFAGLQHLFDTGHYQHEYRFRMPDGNYCWVEDRLRLTYDEQGEPEDIIGYWINIDARKRTEQAMQEAKEAAEKANRAKSTFVSSMSHELRTPLNAILGLAEVMQHEDSLPPALQDNINAISTAGNHLLVLVNEILDLAKIESGTLDVQLEAVHLDSILSECLALTAPLASERDISLDYAKADNQLYVSADYTRLKQVLLNLLSNAIKYNKPSGRVTISYGTTPGSHVRITITDTGPGIDKQKLSELFQPFNRLGAENSNIKGTGIGLYYSKQLIESMDGSIGADSIEDIGSSFWLELHTCAPPLLLKPSLSEEADSVQIVQKPDTMAASAQTAARVLVAEDNKANQALIMQQLELLGYQADIADDGEQALSLWRANQYDILLTDINMPHMDGIRLTTLIRNEESVSKRRFPIIAITANALHSDVEECLRANMDDHIAKPISLENLREILHKWLDQESPQKAATAESRTEQEPAYVPAMDPDMLKRLVGNNKDLHRRLLNKFIETAPETITAINDATINNNTADVCAQAHKLKSSARAIGANRLADLCQDLEQAGRADNLRTIRARVAELDILMHDVRDYADNY